VITSDDAQNVSGTACANCLVELFLSDSDASDHGEALSFMGDAKADGAGNFAVSVCGRTYLPGMKLSATSTDTSGNTSEFSLNYAPSVSPGPCPSATPSPTHSATPTATAGAHKPGDLDCSGKIDTLDGLIAFQFISGASLLTRPVGCPAPDAIVGAHKFGDVNCDGAVDELDGVDIVAYAAGVPREQPGGCPAIG
jgi:hypothetical protein